MKKTFVFISESLKKTELLGSSLANLIHPGDTITLKGELGAGKTTLVNEILRSLGTDSSGSPTFIIVNSYETRKCPLYHVDFYRIESEDELYERGIPDIAGDPQAITIIEWADRFPEIIPPSVISIDIEVSPEGEQRKFTISFPDEREIKLD